MVATNFNACLTIILREEGHNDDDPRDHGGRTSRGIIQREWDSFRKTHNGRPSDVWEASDEDIATIYKGQYWNPYCDEMPSGVDLCFFNASVNSGRTQAVKELQRALGTVAGSVDGMFGMVTKQALADFKDTKALVRSLSNYRRKFYQALKQFPIYGKGWLGRTDRVEQSALVMASGTLLTSVASTHPKVDTLITQPTVTVSAKASPTDGKSSALSPETSGAVAAGSGSIAGTISQIQEQLTPFAGTLKFVQYMLLAVALIGIIYMVYGMIKRNHVAQAVG